MGLSNNFLMDDGMVGHQQSHASLAIANQRSEEPSGACVQYKNKGNVGSDHVGVLEFGLHNDM